MAVAGATAPGAGGTGWGAATLPGLLEARAAAGRPVRVGLVGAGRFGTTVAAQVGQMRGLALLAVADVRAANAGAAPAAAGWAAGRGLPPEHGRAASVAAGRPVWLEDGTRLAELPLDVVVEATGRPDVSARVVWACLGAGQHVVNVTVELDVLLGALFRRRADSAGVVYTVADGDQPGCTMRLVEWARALGYRVGSPAGGRSATPSTATGCRRRPSGATATATTWSPAAGSTRRCTTPSGTAPRRRSR